MGRSRQITSRFRSPVSLLSLALLAAPVGSQTPAAPESPAAAAPAAHPLDPAIELMMRCRQRYAQIADYSATLVKQEALGDKPAAPHYLQMKCRRQPFSIYFKWIQPEAGKEAIFVEGQNGDRIVTHGTGLAKALAGTIHIDPDSSLARKGNRHSIREAGIGNMIEKLISRWNFERQHQETEVAFGSVRINGRPCYRITTVHPYPDSGKFMFHTLVVYVDIQELLPIRLEGYAYGPQAGRTPGPLLECYTYLDLRLNTGASDLDFSARNPAYSFSRF